MFLILIVCLMKLLEMTSKRALMRQRAVQANRRASGAGGDDGGFGGCECAAGRGCCLDDDNDAGVMMVHVGKENRAINGHLRNYLSSSAAIKNGYKQIKRGMIDPSHAAHHHYHAHKPSQRPLSQTDGRSPTVRPQQQPLPTSPFELTESGLRDNVQIVLNNLQRNAFYAGTAAEATAARKRSIASFASSRNMLSSPESDCNSNPHPNGSSSVAGGLGSLLSCSIASSHDFTHDNSDYQWFLEYRDGVTHQSILSSLSASYTGIGELSYYEDLAKNIDANLAEVDMESFTFRQADANNADDPGIAPLTAVAVAAAAAAAQQQHSRNEQRSAAAAAAAADMDNSICTSKQLFSPVKETVTLSVDSLDLDGFGEGEDIILTCRANKDNYTIAFEGSAMYSEESYYGGGGLLQRASQLRSIDDIIRRKALEVSMSRSDTGFTTWSKLKKNSSHSQQLQRYPSGNNNTTASPASAGNTGSTSASQHECVPAPKILRHAAHCCVRKSSSMPDLKRMAPSPRRKLLYMQEPQLPPHQLHVSQALSASGSSCGTGAPQQHSNMLPMFAMPPPPTDACCSSGSDSPAPLLQQSCASSSHSGGGGRPQAEAAVGPNVDDSAQQPAFNLVKLFIKQKSSSTDTCMDVSSGCWPSSESPSSSQEQQQQLQQQKGGQSHNQQQQLEQQRQRKKSMHDSGKGSALSRHDEDMESGDFQYDSLDVAATAAQKPTAGGRTNDLYREVFDAPARTGGSGIALNIRTNKQLMANLQNNINNNNSMDRDSLKETNSSCTDTTTDDTASRTSNNITQCLAQAQIPAALMSRSMQTSMRLSQTVTCGTAGGATSAGPGANGGRSVKILPPSFLAQLSQNSGSRLLGESQQAPVYVIYPNYALPDLAFVNHSDVILSPLSYTKSGMSPPPSLDATAATAIHSGKPSRATTSSHTPKNPNIVAQRRRPVSLLDCDELIRNKDYKHIGDWNSLAALLPSEYRNLLRHIPEVSAAITAAPSQRPMFSMSPPLRHGQSPVVCDCAQYPMLRQSPQSGSRSGSGSGSSDNQRASSGYRGSSTMLLTDSDVPNGGSGAGQNAADPMRNMYVYQYENNTHMDDQQQSGSNGVERPPSGRQAPRGILRRMNSKTRVKRNSMFEEPTATLLSSSNTAAEKRRSLQDQPYYNEQANNIIEDYLAELDDQDQQQRQHHHQHTNQEQQHRLNNSRVYTPADDNIGGQRHYSQELHDDQLGDANDQQQRAQKQHEAAAHYYTEVANILQSIEKTTELYDRHKLRSQVSRALSQQYARNEAAVSTAHSQPKKVSFDGGLAEDASNVVDAMGATITLPSAAEERSQMRLERNQQQQQQQHINQHHRLSAPPAAGASAKEFTTPPNSPNISVAQLRLDQKHKRSVDQEKLDKIQSNRFKRLQIQWELLSKEAQVLQEELAVGDGAVAAGGRGGLDLMDMEAKETRSGGSTPTSVAAIRSRIPRPVSYPATKATASPSATAKQLQSPSRMVAPKRYGSASSATATATAAASMMPNRSRTPSKLNTTPKRTVPTPRTSSARSSR